MRIEVINKLEYLITLDYQLVEKIVDPKRFEKFLQYRYKFTIINSRMDSNIKQKEIIKSLIIYKHLSPKVINTLFSNHWVYTFSTDEIFTNTRYSTNSLIVHKYYKGQKQSEFTCSLTPNFILNLVQELDNQPTKQSEEDKKDMFYNNNILQSENTQLKKLIKDLKSRINESIKGLRK